MESSIANNVKSKVLLSSVVKNTVKLKSNGPNHLGLCPFHEEKTPSFYVRDKVGRFKCFGCGAAGDVFDFIMRLRGLGFKEAIAELAEARGIVSNKPDLKRGDGERKTDPLLRAQAVAQSYFVKELKNGANSEALRYLLDERGLSLAMIEQSGVGFGGNSRQRFFDYLKKNHVDEKIASEAGLVYNTSISRNPKFIGRITFPIKDLAGRIIAFGARAFLPIHASVPKYVNTHRYKHFEKHKVFYGLYESKEAILKGKVPILVEGYFDAMAFWGIGHPAIALCGTSLSESHIAVLKRLTRKLSFCLDSDQAGINALRSALILIFKYELIPDLIELGQKDPGDYLSSHNLNELMIKSKSPVDAVCHLIDLSANPMNLNTSERMAIIDSLLPILREIRRPLLRRQYVLYLAKSLHEDPGLLWKEIHKKSKSRTSLKSNDDGNEVRTLSALEGFILRSLIGRPQIFKEIAKELVLFNPVIAGLFEEITKVLSAAPGENSFDAIKQSLSLQYAPFLTEIAVAIKERVELSDEEAIRLIADIKEEFKNLQRKDSLAKKRKEVHAFEKQKDYSSAIKSLQEKSAMLHAVGCKMKKKYDRNVADLKTSDESRSIDSVAQKKKYGEVNTLEQVTSFFDTGDDWL